MFAFIVDCYIILAFLQVHTNSASILNNSMYGVKKKYINTTILYVCNIPCPTTTPKTPS